MITNGINASKIRAGDKVRSYDFEGNEQCYMEGVVIAIVKLDGCRRYKIKVERQVWGGEVVREKFSDDDCVYPPVNGTVKTFGGVCNFVKRLA